MNSRGIHITGLLFCILIFCMDSKAQPSISSSQLIGEQRVYRDVKLANLFYYMPFDYKLVTDSKGKPEFSMIQMRYTGTRAGADAGVAKFNNLLQFKVSIDPQHQKKITELRTALRQTYPAAELRPLPVRKFSSILVFAGTQDTETTEGTSGSDSLRLVKTSYAEATNENSSGNNSYWNDRIITLRLNNFDAQLVESALKNHQSVMSFSYAIYSVFSETDPSDINVTGSKEIHKKVKDFFESEIKNQKDSALRITMVKADVVSLDVNLDTWPTLVQKVDINEKVPARYALFDVYCYDFNNELRADLYAKKIEIRATSVNGSEITTTFSFKMNQPDLYAKSIRFPYAVRFDKPFYYRVTEINMDGEASATEWIEKKDWSELLDITSTPDKVVLRPTEIDQ
jgi:hypothetical protein